MSKKGWKAGAVLAAGAGITAVLAAKKRGNMEMDKMKKTSHGSRSDYRNTELGKHDKNSKGIYYTNGNYEAFARPEKPAGIEEKSAYLVGSGLASLAAACFLVRDAQMPGKNIHILEAMDIAGGACDGIDDPTRGYVMRGGREMEDHFECLWDLFHSIPSLEVPGASVLDEYYWLNKHDPNYSLCRATERRGEDAHTDGKFGLSQKGSMEIMKLFFTKDEDLYDKTIEDVFDDEVFGSQFWLYWRTMFAFENWHSALEMKLYIQRYIHHIGGLPDFTALRFTRYNQYESMILPMVKYLEDHNVTFHFGVKVNNVLFDCSDIEKTNWESATVTTANEEIIDQIKKICKRDPRTGKGVTGGIVSCRDSKWLLSWTINRQGQFKNQKKDEVCVWVYSLFTDVPGDYVKKPMKECTGKEITAEWLYHLGIPVEDIERLAGEECNCTPTMMPYITAFFMPRAAGDRPDVIPDGSVNAAFLGQFAETPRDTIFTTEYSVRTAMEAVYGLCGVDRGVPEVWGSVYDVRELLDSTVKLMDGKSPLEMKLPMPFEMLKKPLLRKIDKTIVGKLLRDHDVLKDWML